jgi:signal peptidase II
MKELDIFLFFKSFLRKFFYHIILIFNVFFITFLDLLSKKIVKNAFLQKCDKFFLKPYKVNLYYKCKIEITDFLKFTYVENHGVVFGILSNFKYVKYVMPILILIPISFIVQLIYKTIKDSEFSIKQKKIQIFLLSIILGGGISNIIDRVANGFVFDFIDVYYKQYHWYAFNVADCFICTGIIGLIIFDLFYLKKKKTSKIKKS